MKKRIAYIMAVAMLLGFSTPAYGATFADIDTVTWSGFKPFLTEAASLGLMNGYEEGGKRYCKPRNNVTYCETTQLMYSIMKVHTKQDVSDATVTKWKPIMSAYSIPSWAYKAVAYSLENSILSTVELSKLQNGTRYATREDVAVIFGKALDMVNGYDIQAGATLSYKDGSSISTTAVPYVELLNRADLMVGDTDNKFNPKAYITRAEMAVLSVKNYEKLAKTVPLPTVTEGAVVGTVDSTKTMANGDLFISLKTNTGTVMSLFASDDVVPRYDGKKIKLSDIGTGDTVKATYKDTNITALEVTHSKKGIFKTTEVTYELSDLTKSKVIILDGRNEKSFHLDDDVVIRIADAKSSISKLQDALDDKRYFDATLTLDQNESVLEINAKLNDNNPLEGIVVDLDDFITIENDDEEYSYPLDSAYEVEQDGKSVRISTFEDEYIDNQYEVKLKLNKNNDVSLVEIEAMEDEFNGELTGITTKRIEFLAANKTYEYDFADNPEIKIDGKSSSVDKLRSSFREEGIAYHVKVSLNRDDEVTELIATSKNAKNSSGKLRAIDEEEITILIEKKEYTYDIASKVEVTVNNKSRDLEDLIAYFGEYAFDVVLKFDKYEEVVDITATIETITSGILRNIMDEDYITIKAADINQDIDLASKVNVSLEDEEVTLKELNDEIDYAVGDSHIYVELEYNSSGKITSIQAYWEDATGELSFVDPDEDRIKVGTERYDVGRKVEIFYKLAPSVDEDDYKSIRKYEEDLEGLEEFMDDCVDADDNCIVSLTLDKDKEVTRIRATAR